MWENAGTLANLSSVAMLLVWAAYLQLFLSDHKRQRRAHLIIHQAAGFGLDSTYLLVNMSTGPAHIQCVRVLVETRGGRVEYSLGAREGLDDLKPWQLEGRIRQGPLESGGFLVLGSLREFLARVAPEGTDAAEAVKDVREVVVQAVAIYGTTQWPVGARRRFAPHRTRHGFDLRPTTVHTEQLITRRQRQVAGKWLRQCMED